MKKKLSKKSEKLLSEFSSDAMSWGWMQDQGVGGNVEISKKDYEYSLKALTRRILSLENRIKKQKAEIIRLRFIITSIKQ